MNPRYRLLLVSFFITIPIILFKYFLHELDWELIVLGSLHSSVVSGTFFVIGFLLSATIADYKESERIPAEFSAIVENMYEDAVSIHKNYPKVDFKSFKKQLEQIATSFGNDVRNKTTGTQVKIHKLSEVFASMETAGVPANYIVKLKQQQARLIHILLRVNYIQIIKFIPSATVLARSIVGLTIGLLVFTEIEPFYGGLAIVSIIAFIMIYILKLIRLISTPFRSAGKTQDDVSLFLPNQTANYIKKSR